MGKLIAGRAIIALQQQQRLCLAVPHVKHSCAPFPADHSRTCSINLTQQVQCLHQCIPWQHGRGIGPRRVAGHEMARKSQTRPIGLGQSAARQSRSVATAAILFLFIFFCREQAHLLSVTPQLPCVGPRDERRIPACACSSGRACRGVDPFFSLAQHRRCAPFHVRAAHAYHGCCCRCLILPAPQECRVRSSHRLHATPGPPTQ